MTNQLFQNSSHADVYRRYRPGIPDKIVDEILRFSGVLGKEMKPSLAIDVGCGTGQMTERLSPYFKCVKGFDKAQPQISEAIKASSAQNVEYSVSPAESLPLKADSVTLVTAATAGHWFDFPRFCQEVERVLIPGGCLAVLGYTLKMKIHNSNEVVENRANDCIKKFMETIEPYRKIPFEEMNEFYANYTVSFGDLHRQNYEHRCTMTMATLINFYITLSMVVERSGAQPELDVIGDLQKGLLSAFQQDDGDPEKIVLDTSTFYGLGLVRKPTPSR